MPGFFTNFRKTFFPNVRDSIESVFDVQGDETDQVIRGERNLGTFFLSGIGYSEDTWPFIIVGIFQPVVISIQYLEQYFELSSVRQWIILDAENRFGVRETWYDKQAFLESDTRRKTCDLRGAEILTWGGDDPVFRVVPAKERGSTLSMSFILSKHLLVGVVASRINFLLTEGRSSGICSQQIPEWGKNGEQEWKNPDRKFMQDLKNHMRRIEDP